MPWAAAERLQRLPLSAQCHPTPTLVASCLRGQSSARPFPVTPCLLKPGPSDRVGVFLRQPWTLMGSWPFGGRERSLPESPPLKVTPPEAWTALTGSVRGAASWKPGSDMSLKSSSGLLLSKGCPLC